uniref:Rapid alkalinization factor-like n=1 Tax=Ananas comosus var. bracteatus TaxID=296719 RepID=A0A6V7PGE1_ANACO|nr:unnamed protein product [Ananas comosus var. bracteatus]
MANATPSSPALLLLLLLLSAASAAAASDSGSSVGECAVFEEVSRRVLAGGMGDYINYAALRPDSVPCSHRGASYSNCRPGAQAHPYSRGCSTITHCRSS